jgi:tetratricopeptide (TPR) repeat protein
LQEAWRQRLRQDGHLRHGASSDTELELKLEKLKDQFAELRRGFRRWQQLVAALLIGGLLLTGYLVLVQRRTKQATDEGFKTVIEQVKKQDQPLTLDRIRTNLREASERALQSELAEADKVPQFDERERLREQAHKAHEIRLRRVDDLAADFVALGQKEDNSPVLREMLRILNDEKVNPVDKAITYLDRQLQAILSGVDARTQAAEERNRSDLQPVLKAAQLEQTRGRPDAARKHFELVLARQPAWPEALESYAYFLFDQSLQSRYHGSLRAALDDAQRSFDLAAQRYSHDNSRPESQRLVFVASEQLGDVLVLRARPGDAEEALKHYTRGLKLSEDLLKRNPESAKAARDVSMSLNTLGAFLAQRGGAGDADQALKHYTRSLGLREDLLKRNPDSAQAARDVMVSQYKLGELCFKRHTFESAIAHFMAGIAVLDGMIAKGLNAERAVREKAILEGRLQRSREALATRRPESAAGR